MEPAKAKEVSSTPLEVEAMMLGADGEKYLVCEDLGQVLSVGLGGKLVLKELRGLGPKATCLGQNLDLCLVGELSRRLKAIQKTMLGRHPTLDLRSKRVRSWITFHLLINRDQGGLMRSPSRKWSGYLRTSFQGWRKRMA
ncbi:hypothetical protein I3760_04G132000 [Carya illinoinensis]|nr:hypothetical protein I3760_04G132000 [Carya illinoinensis]